MTVERRGVVALVALGFWFLVTFSWWCLAFAPLPVPVDWLDSARAVCFGSTPTGLPAAEGWLVLVAGPVSMLALIVAIFGSEVSIGLRRLGRYGLGRIALGGIAAGVIVGLVLVGGRVARVVGNDGFSASHDEPLPEHYPRGQDEVPEFQLIDQFGDEISLATSEGRSVVLTFAFAHCQTICPTLVDRASRAVTEAEAQDPVLLVVTLDPWRDTPSSLPRLAKAWNFEDREDVHILSGEPEQVVEVLDSFQVPYQRDLNTGDVSHPALLYLIDAEGRLAYSFLNPPVGWITSALKRLDKERS